MKRNNTNDDGEERQTRRNSESDVTGREAMEGGDDQQRQYAPPPPPLPPARGRSNTDPTAATSITTITPSPSIPSLLSPVGESRNYCLALDEDDIIDLSAITPSMTTTTGFHHPQQHFRNGGSGGSGGGGRTSSSNNKHFHNNKDQQTPSSPSSPPHSTRSSRFSNILSSSSNGNYLDGDHFGTAISPLVRDNGHDDDHDQHNHSGFFRFGRRRRQQQGASTTTSTDDDDDNDDDDFYNDYHRFDHHDDNSDLHNPLLGSPTSATMRVGNHHNHHNDHHDRATTTSRVRLNGLNYLNVLTYLANAFMSFCIGYAGLWGSLPTRWQISKDYETLVTPAEFAYYLWAPILVFELIFAIAQLLPNYRARPIVQQGTGYFFFWTCFIQTAWTLFFAFEWFICSFICAVLALLSLASLLTSQHYYCVMNGRSNGGVGGGGGGGTNHSNTKSRRLEYWLFRFPFYLHCGWLIMCSIVQFSIIFRYYTSNIGVQLSADIFSLGVMLPAATFFLTGQPSGPDFVIPIVVIWSYASIAIELNRPSETLLNLYGHASIVAVRNASIFFAGTVGVMLIPRVIVWIAQEFCTISVVEFDNDEGESQYRFSFYSPPTFHNHNNHLPHHHHHGGTQGSLYNDSAMNSGRGFSIRSIEEEYNDDDENYDDEIGQPVRAANSKPSHDGNDDRRLGVRETTTDNVDDDLEAYYDAQNCTSEIDDDNQHPIAEDKRTSS